MAPTLVLGATDAMRVMQEEIFGPILPLKTYAQPDEALAYINDHPRPLAAYYFGPDAARQQRFADLTTSGALVVNDVMTHASIESVPFGGVGPSGHRRVPWPPRLPGASATPRPWWCKARAASTTCRLRAPYAGAQAHIEKMLGG